MAWTEITRQQYRRDGLRYASGTTDREWAVLEPLLPAPRRLGRPRKRSLRAIVEAILYVLATGCQWRALPQDFPPRSTVQGYFYRWRDDGTWCWISDRLVACARRTLGRNAAPTAGIIDSQSAPTTESGGPRGIDAGKRVKGRKRHIVTDTQGFLLVGQVHQASIQDPHGAVPLLRALRRRCPELHHIFADRRQRLPAPAPAMGRRAHLCLARPKSKARQGLRGYQRQRHCMALPRSSPPALQTTGKGLIRLTSFRVRL